IHPAASSRRAMVSPSTAFRACPTCSGPVGFALTNSTCTRFCVRGHNPADDPPLPPLRRPRRHAVRGSFGGDASQDVVQPPFGDEDVDEPRTRDLDLPDERRRWQRRDDRLGDRPRGCSDPGRNREGDVGCEVPVLLLPGLHHLGLGELAVEPELGRRGLEARTEPGLELVLDHAPAPPIEARTVSIKACASKGLVMYWTPGATGVVFRARAVRNTTGIAPSSGSSWSLR